MARWRGRRKPTARAGAPSTDRETACAGRQDRTKQRPRIVAERLGSFVPADAGNIRRIIRATLMRITTSPARRIAASGWAVAPTCVLSRLRKETPVGSHAARECRNGRATVVVRGRRRATASRHKRVARARSGCGGLTEHRTLLSCPTAAAPARACCMRLCRSADTPSRNSGAAESSAATIDRARRAPACGQTPGERTDDPRRPIPRALIALPCRRPTTE
jgi:hypothetical protein